MARSNTLFTAAAVGVALALTGCGDMTANQIRSTIAEEEFDVEDATVHRPGDSVAPLRESREREVPDSEVTGARCKNGAERRRILLTGVEPTARVTGFIEEPHGAKYQLTAALRDDGCTVSGEFEYRELGCSGTWAASNVEELSNGGPNNSVRVEFEESVNDDPQKACSPTAKVTLLYGPGGMYYWSSWNRADGEATDSRTLLTTQ